MSQIKKIRFQVHQYENQFFVFLFKRIVVIFVRLDMLIVDSVIYLKDDKYN